LSTHILINNKKDISEKKFSYILKKFKNTKIISLSSGFGEPLLHPFFKSLLSLSEKNKKEIILFTNCNVKRDLLYPLITQPPILKLILSIDYAERKKYEKIRKGANFYVLLKNLKIISDYKINHPSSTEIILSKVFLPKDKLSDLFKLIHFSKRWNIQKIEIRYKYPLIGEKKYLNFFNKSNSKRLIHYANKFNINLILPQKKENLFCGDLENNLYFDLAGDIKSCCFDPSSNVNINIFNTKIKLIEIYFNNRFIKLPQLSKKCFICPQLYYS
jgi:organic radical activating enzyme